MLSRALILATAMLSTLVAAPDLYAQNLDAGKSASQLFSNTCAACHRSQRGLLKSVAPGSLPGFLREHYTTSKDMAQQMSAFLLSNGATDPRGSGSRLTKQGQDAKSGGQGEPAPAEQQGRRTRAGQPQEAARPDADGVAPDPRTARQRARQERLERRQQLQAAPAVGPDGQALTVEDKALTKRQKQKMGKTKGREQPKPVAAPAPVDATTPDAMKPDGTPAEMPKPVEPAPVVIDPAIDAPKPDPARPAEPSRPNGSASEQVRQDSLRPDPVPQVTPAPAEAPTPAPSEAPLRPSISVTPPPPPPPPSGPPTAPISQ